MLRKKSAWWETRNNSKRKRAKTVRTKPKMAMQDKDKWSRHCDGEGEDDFDYGEGPPRSGVMLRWRWDKEGNCSPLSSSRFTLQHQNPSNHWSAHCSLHHDKRTLELLPSPLLCLLSFGSSSVLVPYGLLRCSREPPLTQSQCYEKMFEHCGATLG